MELYTNDNYPGIYASKEFFDKLDKEFLNLVNNTDINSNKQ